MQGILDQHKRFSLLNSMIVFLLSSLVIVAYQFNLLILKNIFPGRQLSNPITASCFLLSVNSLLFLVSEKKLLQSIGKIIAAIICVTGLIRFAESFTPFTSGIDRWLYPTKLSAYGNFGKANFMAPNTAALFALLGAALFFYRYRFERKNLLCDLLSFTVSVLSFLCTLGFLYKSAELYSVKSSIPMAFPTAISFFLISTAVLLRRSRFGFFSLFTRKYSGSRIARFLIPFAVCVPVIAGYLQLYGEARHLFSSGLGEAILDTTNVLIFIFLIWRCCLYLNRENQIRMNVQEQLREFNQQLEQEVVLRTSQLQQREEEKTLLEKSLLEEKLNQQKKMMQATIDGQEKEKKQIGMELHDNVNQILASVKLYIEMARTDEILREEMLSRSKEQINYAISEIRNLSKSLVPHGIENSGLKESIIEFVETIQQSKRIQFFLTIEDAVMEKLGPKQQIAIYRIIQEQLNNIVKYAEARAVSITLSEQQNTIELSIKDDGKGFDTTTKKSGIGLSNIKSRVELLDGKMEIESSPGYGCRLKVCFYLPQITEMLRAV